MKYITQLIGELMPGKKRGETRFITTNSMKNTMRFEVIDNVQ